MSFAVLFKFYSRLALARSIVEKNDRVSIGQV
jgi:hypothetical protein